MAFEIHIDIPVRTVSLANVRIHWARRARMVKQQRAVARVMAAAALGGRGIPPRLVVTMTRLTPPRGRSLDTDNLVAALKPVRDGIADALGIDDGDDAVVWVCEQGLGRVYAVRVRMEER